MNDIIALEQQLAASKSAVEKRQMAIRLADNYDFKQLILKDFCVEECARYAQASADPSLGANERADALALAQAAGHLRRFLSVQIQMGSHAERNIVDLENAIAEARAEGDE